MARPVNVKTLRRGALRQLSERLKEGKMSTADLIRVAAIRDEDENTMPWGNGPDWVLSVAGDDGDDSEEDDLQAVAVAEAQPQSEQLFADGD